MSKIDELEIVREEERFVLQDAKGKEYGQIDYIATDDSNVVEAPHTLVSEELQGQGAAGRLLDRLVEAMEADGKKIKAVCPYIVKKFNEQSEKYDHINAEK